MQFEPLEAAARVFMDARTAAFWRYFAERGLGRDILDRFRVGISPTWPVLGRPRAWRKAFTAAGFFDPVNDVAMRNYLGRYTFPLMDPTNRITGFVFRDTGYPMLNSMGSDDEGADEGSRHIRGERARYVTLGTRERMPFPPGFVQQANFYGLPGAETGLRVVLVEGPVDCLRCISAGYPETVSVLGVANAKDRALELLRNPDREVILMLDADQPGRLNAIRTCMHWSATRDSHPGTLQVALIPSSWEGKDPGELEDAQIKMVLSGCLMSAEEFLNTWPRRGIDPEDVWQVQVFSQWLDTLSLSGATP